MGFLDLLRRILKDPDCSFALPKSSAKSDDDEKDSRSKPRGPSHRPINERHFDSGASLKNFDGTLFRDITKEDIRKLIKKYKDQVPSLCEKQLLTDYTLLQILAVGHKHHIPYLSMLSDDYMRCRVKVVIESDRVKDLTVAEWADPETHPHFRKLKDLKVRVTKRANVHEFMPHHELVKSAVDCYHNRIAKRFDFSPQCKIYNSMEIVVEYIVHHINFVHGKLRDIDADQNAVGTFQVDLCLILGPARSEDPELDYSFSEDDPDADPVYRMDPIVDDVKDPEDNEHPGDIGAKLAKRGIPYYSMKHGDGNRFKGSESSDIVPRMSMHRHGIKMLYNDIDNGPESVRSAHSFVYQKRVVLTADLTDFQSMHSVEQREGEKVWMYLPGGIGPVIPRDAVPEWGFGSTSEMIVPGIGANKDCDGSLLTLSIQVWQKNVVKAYLFWNGKVMRFMPEDIRSVLPIIFNMDYPGNRAFAQSEKAINGYIERIQPALVDVQFDLFRSDK